MIFPLPLIFLIICACSCEENKFFFLTGYESLNYDPKPIENSHRRLRRSIFNGDDKKSVNLKFESHGRKFDLELMPDDKSSFAPDHQGFMNDKLVKGADFSFLYKGRDLNYPNSEVFGSLIGGTFDGEIWHGSVVYYVEKISRYTAYQENQKIPENHNHSIIYTDKQVDYSKLIKKRDVKTPGCGMDSSVFQKMRDVQNSAMVKRASRTADSNEFGGFRRSSAEEEKPWTKYTEHAQLGDDFYGADHGSRTARQATPQKDARTGFFSGRTCTLYLQADQKLWEYVFNHEGQRNNDRTRDEIFAMFNNHVKAVNGIYESTDFSGIWDNSTCPNSDLEDAKKNPFCDENVDVSNYLNLNSMKNQSDFCLAYALTYRDFVGGTLGLAWVASSAPDGSAFAASSGGICELYKWYSEGSRRVKRSLNTGVITLVNYHNRVPTKVSQLTLAHEIGHNFGSQHDFPSFCQPGLPDGNFIMFASATSGDKPNNAKFSPCSVANISAVLKEVLTQPPNLDVPGAKRNCLIDPLTSFCGNGVVEEGEQCDCGFDEAECKERQDTCCYPRTTDGKRNAKGCERLDWAKCSPTQGPCCSRDCNLIVKTSQTTCRQASDCSQMSFCDGTLPVCPAPLPRPDRTLCQENTKICNAGSCNQSICELIGMAECFITTGTPEDQCQLSCRKSNDVNAKCLPSTSIAALRPYFLANSTRDRSRAGIFLRPGSPCNDYKGYCDIFQKCRSVDSNGPLSRLKNLLFNSETLKTVGEWVQVYWWGVVLMGLALVCIMALFIKCCAVHTPSTNPRKAPAQSIYETLRHPTTLLRHQHRHRDPSNPHRHHHRHHHRHRSTNNAATAAHSSLTGAPTTTTVPLAVPCVVIAAPMVEPRQPPTDDARRRNDRRRRSATPSSTVAPISAGAAHADPPPPYTERANGGGTVPLTPAQSSSTPAIGGAGVAGPPRGHRKRKRLEPPQHQTTNSVPVHQNQRKVK